MSVHTSLVEALARSISANADIIARNPSDWPDNLQSRADLIAQDLKNLQNTLRDMDMSGGSR